MEIPPPKFADTDCEASHSIISPGLKKFALIGFTLCSLYEGIALASKVNISESPDFAKFISALRDLAIGDELKFLEYIIRLDKRQ